MTVGRTVWNLEDLVDFEVALHDSPTVNAEVGREVRDGLRGRDGSDLDSRRWGLKEWLRSRKTGSGKRVTTVTRMVGLLLLVMTFLLGVGVIRGMVTTVDGKSAINIWVLLAGTIGIQWLILLGGLAAFLLFRYWIGGMGWLKEITSSVVRKLAGKVSPDAWDSLIQGKGKQPSALGWRLTRVLQLGGVGFNLGLIAGLFGVLFFKEINFYWESSMSQFGGDALGKVTRFMAAAWGGGGMNEASVAELRSPRGEGAGEIWGVFLKFLFMSFTVWGLLPRVLLWLFAVRQERKTLAGLEFQDIAHRKLWREMSRVERSVVIEGPSDGVVLLDVGGLNLDTAELRPFLLQTLRVNPEKSYSVGTLDAAEEREAWAAMRNAPCGVVMLVEGWSLSPKQITALVAKLRREAGEDTVLRILVMGDGVAAPDDVEFKEWEKFTDGLRDPKLECIAYQE